MPKKCIPIKDRFWKNVRKSDDGFCWFWEGGKNARGYGMLFNSISKGKYYFLAHRFSYELHKGKIPEGMCVCHSCDTPDCVNPSHLWLGTHAENMKDMYKKGRNPGPINRAKGERHGMAKMTWDKVREIRATNLPKYGRNTILAKKYNVSAQIIERILRNEFWKE